MVLFLCPQSYLQNGWSESRQILYAGGIMYQMLALDNRRPNGRRQSHVTRFLKFAPNHTFGVGETRHFKYCVLIDTEVYY